MLRRSLEDGLIPTPCKVQTHLTTQPTATQRVVCCPAPPLIMLGVVLAAGGSVHAAGAATLAAP
ncbi:MAG: hypothetical protein ACYC2U_07250 [Candidatus Amoebophilus sp.]